MNIPRYLTSMCMEVSLGLYGQNVSVRYISPFMTSTTSYPPATTMPPARIIPALDWHKTCIPLQELSHLITRHNHPAHTMPIVTRPLSHCKNHATSNPDKGLLQGLCQAVYQNETVKD